MQHFAAARMGSGTRLEAEKSEDAGTWDTFAGLTDTKAIPSISERGEAASHDLLRAPASAHGTRSEEY